MTDLDALQAALTAAGVARVYKFGAVPASPPFPYAVLSDAPAAPEVRRLSGSGDPLAASPFSTSDAPPTR